MSSSLFFPPAASASQDGVVAIGGELTLERIIDAYRHGIFPWPNGRGIVEWHSPPLRAVIPLDGFHVSRSLARTLGSGKFAVRRDTDFRGVIMGCATAQDRREHTWITPSMEEAYCRLHAAGVAHSVEAWHDGALAGGVYGVAIGAMFAAESMFYRETDASKVALAHLVDHLGQRGYELLDIQQWTANSHRLGCGLLPRSEFLTRLAGAIDKPVTFG
ncbi:MAG TPA: leucyl/phenylalanyl-tRNA--protein transferase [Pirellulales bacterium]|nr:leucyl/phenylalanyl-tRNA--protein transferase [Pirellulales bacterium]